MPVAGSPSPYDPPIPAIEAFRTAKYIKEGTGLIAVAPGGLFELILPIWLLVKGFNSSSQALPGKR
jgi:hypothetical protein